jgi:hypothetical protein
MVCDSITPSKPCIDRIEPDNDLYMQGLILGHVYVGYIMKNERRVRVGISLIAFWL